MPLRSGGALENEHLRGEVNSGLNARGLPRTFKPSKVGTSTSSLAMAYSIQRKVFYGGTFRVFYFYAVGSEIVVKKSADGVLWQTENSPGFGASSYFYSRAGGLDVLLDSDKIYAQILCYSAVVDYTTQFKKGTLNTTISWGSEKTIFTNANYHIGGSLTKLTTGRLYSAVQVAASPQVNGSYSDDDGENWTKNINIGTTTITSTTGGVQILAMATGKAMCLVKNSVNTLVAFLFNGSTWSSLGTVATGLLSGWGYFTATAVGDVVDVVFIDSAGALKHVRYAGSWGSITTLVSTGCTHPAIVAGDGGRLYVFYVKDAEIKLLKFDGASWLSEKKAFTGHTYNNPAYLSSNQNVQNRKICLVWTEGTASPYEVWFCYLED